jgi:hypothetical protein
MTASCFSCGSPTISRTAQSIASRVCTQTSPSGCQSGSCGQPTSVFSSGNSWSTTPRRSAQSNPDRRARRQQQLLHLAPDPLARQVGQVDAAAQIGGRRIDVEPESGGELHCPQHPQAVLDEGRPIDRPQPSGAQIVEAAPRIDRLVRQRIEQHGVDGEIAPARRLAQRQGGILLHLKAAMPAAGLDVAARQADIEVGRRAGSGRGTGHDLVHGERLADQVDRAVPLEDRHQLLRAQAEYLEVVVVGRGRPRFPAVAPQRPVAHPSTDQVGHTSRLPDREADRQDVRLDRRRTRLRCIVVH